MSVFTTQVRFICENYCGLTESVGYDNINTVIEKSQNKIFDFPYPIFDESYRSVLQTKILKHFYTREIGEETVALWKLRLDDRLNTIMPYYNQLYESELLKFNPLHDVELTTTYTKKAENNESGNSSENSSSSENTLDTTNGSFSKNVTDKLQTTDSKTIDTNNSENSENNVDTKNTHSEDNRLTDKLSKSADDSTKVTGITKESDTPMGALKGLDDDTYMTKATKSTSDTRYTTDSMEDLTRKDLKEISDLNESFGRAKNTFIGKTNDVSLIQGNNTSNETGNNSNMVKGDRDSQTNITRNSKNDIKSLEDYTQLVTGKNGGSTYSKMLLEFRETFLNIDKMILDELRDLFMNIWKVEDGYYGYW